MSRALRNTLNVRVMRRAEMLLVALLVGVLLWFVQTQHGALHIADRWVDERIAAGAAVEADRDALLRAYRAAYTWQDAEGEQRAYPVSRDSYYFLRLARNIIDTGSPCPDSNTDSCLDTRVNPDTGRPMQGARSPHPWAIAGVYLFFEAAGMELPLLQAGVLHNRLMLVLCGLLAYLLARELSPAASRGGSLAVAVLMTLIPAVIQRSFGVDNDVWVLALMLGGVFVTARLLSTAVSGFLRLTCATLAIAVPLVLSATWGGWLLLVIVQFITALLAIAATLYRNTDRHFPGNRVKAILVATAVCLSVLAVVLLQWLSGGTGQPQTLDGALPAPDVFASVAELASVDINRLVAAYTWPVLVTAVFGLAVALQRLWHWKTYPFPAALLLTLGWFAGALILLLTQRYDRYLILLAPPLALLAGLGVSALPALLPRIARRRLLAPSLALLLIAATTVNAVLMVRENRPQLNTAWVGVLDSLARTSPENAIVAGWWNVGHWVSFWSRRTSVIDGASLLNPRVHDVGRLLADSGEGDLEVLLSRVACGRDFGCQRPVYLVTSNDLLRDPSWMISGFWLASRAALIDRLTAGHPVPAGISEDLALTARNVDTAIERSLFAAPDARVWSTDWSPCQIRSDNTYDCSLNVTSRDGLLIERLVMPAGRVNEAMLVVRQSTGETPIALPPSMMRVATEEQLLDVSFETSTNNPGILLDVVNARAFLGTPALIRSLLARLVLLEGRYDEERFARVSSASTVDGFRVDAWRAIPE